MSVLSFAEGQPTPLAGFIPKVVIVPFESAYPGYGGFRLLSDHDHIDICKPTSREDPIYTDVLAFVRGCLAGGGGGVESGGGAGEGPPAGGGAGERLPAEGPEAEA